MSYLQSLSPPLWSVRALRQLPVAQLAAAAAGPAHADALFDLQLVLQSLSDASLQAWLVLITLHSVPQEVWRDCLGPSCTLGDIAALAQVAQHTKAALTLAPSVIDPSLKFDAHTRLLTQASLPWLIRMMLKEEYRLLDARIVEVVLMTHTVFVHSTEFLRLLLRFYDDHRGDSNPLLRTLAMDAIGYWFCSPLYLRPDHMTEQFVGTWQAYVQSLIAAGTIRESEKTTFKKFTQLLASHYAKLEAQVNERKQRSAAKKPRAKVFGWLVCCSF